MIWYKSNPETEEAEKARIQQIREALVRGDRDSIQAILKIGEKALISLYDYIKRNNLTNKTKFDPETATSIILHYYRALGFISDHRSDGWLSSSGQTKIKLMARNLQIFKGGRGHWRKSSSLPLSQAALNLTQKAAELFSSPQATKIAERKIQEKEKAQERKTAIQQRQCNDTYSLYLFSKNLEPAERSVWLQTAIDDGTSLETLLQGPRPHILESYDDRGELQVREIYSEYYQTNLELKEVEALFTIETPPLFTEESRQQINTTTEVGGKILPLIYERHERNIIINIGGLPINPLSMRPDFYRYGFSGLDSAGLGAVGYIKYSDQGAHAFLFMIMGGQEKRQGMGRELLRTFCRAIRAYGLTQFIGLAAGEEGQPFLERMHQTGEIAIWAKSGSNWLISCQDIYTPKQYTLFKAPKKVHLEEKVPDYDLEDLGLSKIEVDAETSKETPPDYDLEDL